MVSVGQSGSSLKESLEYIHPHFTIPSLRHGDSKRYLQYEYFLDSTVVHSVLPLHHYQSQSFHYHLTHGHSVTLPFLMPLRVLGGNFLLLVSQIVGGVCYR